MWIIKINTIINNIIKIFKIKRQGKKDYKLNF
jgi:hypothetical protein